MSIPSNGLRTLSMSQDELVTCTVQILLRPSSDWFVGPLLKGELLLGLGCVLNSTLNPHGYQEMLRNLKTCSALLMEQGALNQTAVACIAITICKPLKTPSVAHGLPPPLKSDIPVKISEGVIHPGLAFTHTNRFLGFHERKLFGP